MIAVLLPAARVAPCGLNVAEWARRDPNVGPGGWDRKAADAPELPRVADRHALAIDVREAASLPPPANAGLLVAGVTETCELRRRYAIARDIVAHDER